MDLWFLVLLLITVFTIQVDGQLDSNGFINIDCGLAANSTSQDTNNNLSYVSDEQFIDTGENHVIESHYAKGKLQYLTVRSFPNGTLNCYTLRSITIGSKYLVRALFMYGNYDKLDKLPTFHVHLGVNYWGTVQITTLDDAFVMEIITTATSDYLQVCLINTNQGTPFISVLELRPLKTSIYKAANSTQSLVYFDRLNVGASNNILRYPDDPYDRIWRPFMLNTWSNVSTSSNVDPDTEYETPSLVLQTAATTSSTNQSLDLPWTSDNNSRVFYIILHMAEIQDIPSNALREIDIFSDGFRFLKNSYVLKKLESFWVYYYDTGSHNYNFSIKATLRSTLPPLLNALEAYVITPTTGIPTNSEDVAAMSTIKVNYKVNKGWSGDPCAPKELSWNGISCTYDSTKTPMITALNLSSSGLTGAIVPSFGNLSALQSLDLSYNDLSGDLPTSLDKLSALKYLDITGNDNISTTLPPGLQSKKRDGNLIFRFGSATPSTGKDKKKKSPAVIIAVVVVVVLLLIAAAIIIVVYLRRRKSNKSNIPRPIDSNKPTPQEYYHPPNLTNTQEANIPQDNIAVQYNANVFKQNDARVIWDPDNRRFSYNDLVRITNKFQNNIGTGGFGSVYFGTLENGTKVAVKMRSHTSSQGMKEFLAEAQNLARVHHRYLVSLIGYCMDGDCMALVYEYMQEGTLQKKLMGLDYLHKACNPPLIHRDVKTSNILLNENFEARIADFGLSRAFNNTASCHVSTVVVGTPGYLDPEYSSSYQLSEKSDVFSFGVVMLELITGQPPIIAGPEESHLKEWVNRKLSRGDIESIADPRMLGQYDINSVWKVTDLARKCTSNSSALRPTMSTVVMELKESLDLEISTERTRLGNANFSNDVSQNSAFEMPYMGDISPYMGDISASGPIAR